MRREEGEGGRYRGEGEGRERREGKAGRRKEGEWLEAGHKRKRRTDRQTVN